MAMEPPGAQGERLRREEAFYHFINSLSEEEYRLMRDSNLLGTPGESTAEELRQRLDGAKEQLLTEPHQDTHREGSNSPTSDNRTSGPAGTAGTSSNGDSLLAWLNTFRRTGNTTRSGQSGNQTWRAVSRTNPSSGEFRFSLEININHEHPELRHRPHLLDHTPQPLTRAHSDRTPRACRLRSGRSRTSTMLPPTPPEVLVSTGSSFSQTEVPENQSATSLTGCHGRSSQGNCAGVRPDTETQETLQAREMRRSRARVRHRRAAAAVAPQRSRSPLHRLSGGPLTSPPRSSQTPDTESVSSQVMAGNPQTVPLYDPQITPPGDPPPTSLDFQTVPLVPETQSGEVTAGEVSMETDDQGSRLGPDVPQPSELPTQIDLQDSGASGGMRRQPTIMLDLQVRRIRPGESQDRDSVASRTRSRLRMAENTVTFESDSGGFRRTISRSERAGVRTYISTIRIPLRRISEAGLGEPSSSALRSILRQIMSGFGELSSLMETEAGTEDDTALPARVLGSHGDERGGSLEPAGVPGTEMERPAGAEDEEQAQTGRSLGEGRLASGTGTSLAESGTLPILRLAHFFLLNEDEGRPRGLNKEQIDDLSTRTYGQAGVEGDVGRACSVCISEYVHGNKLRRLPCAHEFHVHCIDRWLSENRTCPICRQPILFPLQHN